MAGRMRTPSGLLVEDDERAVAHAETLSKRGGDDDRAALAHPGGLSHGCLPRPNIGESGAWLEDTRIRAEGVSVAPASPAAVGVDIGCGMMALKTDLKARDLPDDLHAMRTAIESAVPHGPTSTPSATNGGFWRSVPTTRVRSARP